MFGFSVGFVVLGLTFSFGGFAFDAFIVFFVCVLLLLGLCCNFGVCLIWVL